MALSKVNSGFKPVILEEPRLTLREQKASFRTIHFDGDVAEELGSALQKRVRGCESLHHLQILQNIIFSLSLLIFIYSEFLFWS